MKSNTHNPGKYYLLIAFFALAAIAAAIWKFTNLHPLWIYLISINLITFVFYGYDKNQAIRNKNRIPEIVLHILALACGSAGALAGQQIFRHKTKKLKFQAVFIFIAIVQAGLITWWIIGNSGQN